jgi:hypothetical protein
MIGALLAESSLIANVIADIEPIVPREFIASASAASRWRVAGR